jgi:hypothetical protein
MTIRDFLIADRSIFCAAAPFSKRIILLKGAFPQESITIWPFLDFQDLAILIDMITANH